jgi:uncharacterized membrane protein
VTFRTLTAVLRVLAVLLILRVLVAIVANYSDYVPPDFESTFLQGRETTFVGSYRPAFYVHIVSGPFVLVNGLILLSETVRRRCGGLHRALGRVQVVTLLVFMIPSGVVMSRHAFGGWHAGVSFVVLSILTAACAVIGVIHARNLRFEKHSLWMLRTYVLICSAVALRLISGMAEWAGVANPEPAYVVAAWASWVLPLIGFEIVWRLIRRDDSKI